MTSALRSVTEGLVERVARWLGLDRDVRELNNLDETEIAAIARDLRMPVSQLKSWPPMDAAPRSCRSY